MKKKQLMKKGFENRLKQKEDIVDENQREVSFNRGFFYYLKKSYLVYECKVNSFNARGSEILAWKSTGISNHPDNSSMNAVVNSKGNHPVLIMSGLMKVKGALSGLRQFFATESPLKMMKNAFYFTSKALFVLKIFRFLS